MNTYLSCVLSRNLSRKKIKLFLPTIIKITLYVIPFVSELVIILKTFHWNLGSSYASEINKKSICSKNNKDYMYDYIFIHPKIYVNTKQ